MANICKIAVFALLWMKQSNVERFISEGCSIIAVADGARSRHAKYACEILSSHQKLSYFQIRNMKAKAGSGLVGNYYIDHDTLVVSAEGVTSSQVESQQLRALRRRILH